MFHISAKSLSCPNNNFAMTNLTQPGFATYYENTLGYEGSLSRIIQNSVTNSSIPLWLETLCLFMQTRALGWGGDHLDTFQLAAGIHGLRSRVVSAWQNLGDACEQFWLQSTLLTILTGTINLHRSLGFSGKHTVDPFLLHFGILVL